MKRYIDLNIGYTVPYFGPGTLVIILGLLLPFLSWIVSLIVVACGVSILAVREGIIADTEQRRIRKYYTWFNFKFGDWIDVRRFDRIELKYTSESFDMPLRGEMSTSIKSKTFDLVLSNGIGESIELHDFIEYSKGKHALYLFADGLGLKAEDKIAAWVETTNQKRRRGWR